MMVRNDRLEERLEDAHDGMVDHTVAEVGRGHGAGLRVVDLEGVAGAVPGLSTAHCQISPLIGNRAEKGP